MPSADATSSGAATRAAHVLHQRPSDSAALAEVLTPGLDRLDSSSDAVQYVVLTLDADTALAAADATHRAGARAALLPITSVKRAVRLLAHPRSAIAGSVSDIAELLKRAVLKLDQVKSVVLIGADQLADLGAIEEIDAILAEIPKEATRIVIAEQFTAAVKDLAERHLHKARTLQAPPATELAIETLHYVTTSAAARPTMLRRLLDEIDPPSVAIVTAEQATAREAIARLGYGPDDEITVGDADSVAEHAALVILWDLPSTRSLGTVASKSPVRVVAMVAPRDVGALRAAVSGPALVPLVPKDAARTVRAADSRLRADLRAELASASALRELIALEPLFDEHEPAEVAAAAVRLLEREKTRAVQAAIAATVAGTGPAPTRREAPEGGEGRPLRDRPVSDRPLRTDRAESSDRPARREFAPRGDRPVRGGDRPTRSGDRPTRTGDRPARPSFGRDRDDRPARSGAGGGDRPARPFTPRGDKPAGPRAGAGRDDGARKFGPKGFGKARPARGPEEGGSRGEWKERGDRLKNAKRPRRD